MFTGLVIGGCILIAALIVFSYWCVYRAGRERGYEECRLDRAQEALSARHAARHARTQPQPRALARGGESSPSPRPAPRPAEGTMEPSANRWYLPPPGPTSSADIAPVILPAPGTYLPQPRRDSGPGTIAMARLALPATPGEMAAITDEWIERMQAEEAAYREGFVS